MKKRETITKEELVSLGFTDVKEDGTIYFKGELKKEAVRKCPHKKSGNDKFYPVVQFYDKAYRKYQLEKGVIANGCRAIPVNRVVWAWFKGVCPGDLDVDHIDNNPFNNAIVNLQLLTRGENIRKRGKGRNQYNFHLSEKEVIEHSEQLVRYEEAVRHARSMFLERKELVKQKTKEYNNMLKELELFKKQEYIQEVITKAKEELSEIKFLFDQSKETWHYWVAKRTEFKKAYHERCAKI